MPFKLGTIELVIVLAIVVLVFGAGKLPQLGSSFGKALNGFRKGISGVEEDESSAVTHNRNTQGH